VTQAVNATVFPDLSGQMCAPQALEFLQLQSFPPQADEKKALPLLKLAHFGNKATPKGSLRHDANVTALTGCELDYDEGQFSMYDAEKRLRQAGIEAFLYTSPSNTEDDPHWRALLPFRHEFTGTVQEMRDYRINAVERAEEVLGFKVANESRTLSQAFFFGKVADTNYSTRVVNGNCIDVEFNLKISSPLALNDTRSNQIVSTPQYDNVDTEVVGNMIANGQNLHESLRSLSASYAAKGMAGMDIVAALRSRLDDSVERGTARWKERYDSIPRLVESAVRKFQTEEATPVAEVEPDGLHELDLQRIVTTPPPRRAFHFADNDGAGIMPEGEGCGMAGAGGGGKSLAALDLALSLTTGIKWLDHFRPEHRVPVFFFTKEDDGDEIHRRIWSITGQNPAALTYEGLHIYPLLGVDFPLTVQLPPMGIMNGPAVDTIVDIVNQHGGNGLVILDPLRKMSAGKEDGEAMTAAVQACDTIRLKTTGTCTTLLLHHSAKDSIRASETTAAAFRGATDLVDGLRWTMIISKLSPKERTKVPDGSNWRRVTMPKSNYTASNDDGVLLVWDRGRFVVTATPSGLNKTRSIESGARELYGVLLESGPLTERKLKHHFHKDDGPVYAPKSSVEVVCQAAVKLKLIESAKIPCANKQLYTGWKAIDGATDD